MDTDLIYNVMILLIRLHLLNTYNERLGGNRGVAGEVLDSILNGWEFKSSRPTLEIVIVSNLESLSNCLSSNTNFMKISLVDPEI